MIVGLRAKLLLILLVAVLPAICVVGWLLIDAQENARRAAERSFRQLIEIGAVITEGNVRGAARIAAIYGADNALLSGRGCEQRLTMGLSRLGDVAGIMVVKGGQVACAAHARLRTLPAEVLAAIAAAPPGSTRFGTVREPASGLLLWAMVKGESTSNETAVVTVLDAQVVKAPIAGMVSPFSGVLSLVPRDEPADSGGEFGALPGKVREAIEHSGEGESRLIEAPGRHGMTSIYGFRPLPVLGLVLVAEQPKDRLMIDLDRQQLLAILAPALLLAATTLTLWLGLDRLALRWLFRIQRVIRVYAAGKTSVRVGAMPGAPLEIAQFAQAFDTMADSIAQRTHDLEAEIVQRRHYIRELHHRVKNNLQVIGSLLALQRRHLPEAQRHVLRFPEDRVNAISAVYRAAYAQSEEGRIDVDMVVKEVVGRLQMGMRSSAQLDLTADTGGAQVDLDTAVALAMLLAELLPPRLDQAVAAGEKIDLLLTRSGSDLIIDMPLDAVKGEYAGLSSRFAEAYLRQLSARADEGEGRLTVRANVFGGAAKPAPA